MNIEIEKMDIHKGVTVKALLNSSTTRIFIDRKIATKYSFKLQKLKRLVVVKNINKTNNSARVITYHYCLFYLCF